MNFGERLAYARKKKGLLQRQLAELVGVKSNTLCCWETGTYSPAASTRESVIRKIARVLEVSKDWLMGNDDNFVIDNLPENMQKNTKLSKEQQQLVADNVRIIGAAFQRFVRKYHLARESYDDFYGDAAIGLCEAAKHYDYSKGMSFFSFALNCIEWNINRDFNKRKKDLQPNLSLDQVVGLGDSELGSLVPAPDEWEPLEYKVLVESVCQRVEPVLSANEKESFRLWLHGMSNDEISKTIGASTVSVKNRTAKARKKCRALFNPDEIFT